MVLDKKMLHKTLFIRRSEPQSETSPPWDGIDFIYRLGSDELSDRLKGHYLNYQTLRQRKHQAAIDFLREELQIMQAEDGRQINIASHLEQKSFNSPRSERKESQDISSVSSTSRSTHSPPASSSQSPRPPLRVKPSIEPLALSRHEPLSSITTGQQLVFNLRDGRTMHVKTKRKMTDEEREAYKETRKRGACDQCKQKKGKCTHKIPSSPESIQANSMKQGVKRNSVEHRLSPSREGLGIHRYSHDESRPGKRLAMSTPASSFPAESGLSPQFNDTVVSPGSTQNIDRYDPDLSLETPYNKPMYVSNHISQEVLQSLSPSNPGTEGPLRVDFHLPQDDIENIRAGSSAARPFLPFSPVNLFPSSYQFPCGPGFMNPQSMHSHSPWPGEPGHT
ncbi:hypothetical protein CC78DRAFT_546100 [Lojkania enalia]|uniref:Uncharacterized protein n=1 Tax=Lojkania enalia TaxID=147567 RepID=A0A9P4N200_9PLEO|nr:hypothetical protein CC78DRAFT_546100 [Didymosphaeria enalia]